MGCITRRGPRDAVDPQCVHSSDLRIRHPQVENLWPQPWTEAKKKDQLENLLHRWVCDGKVPLKTVQAAIASDWVKAYTKYEGHAP